MEQMGTTLTVLGSTGSIGTQTLEVAQNLGLEVRALTANRNIELMEKQARALKPELVVMKDRLAAKNLKIRLSDTKTRVACGEAAEQEAILMAEAVVCAVSGAAAISSVLFTAQSGKRTALANKEALVCAGSIIKAAANLSGATIIPVDSEHSAIFQCLEGNIDKREVSKLILTASGGPFFGKKAEELENITPKEALEHPNWRMGPKLTVDSATMMNKGLEIIEAMRLYDLPRNKIDVVIHPESVVHSLVEFCDGALLAQLAQPDMRLPIQYALTYPRRLPSPALPLDLASCGLLSFSQPDQDNFPCLAIASRVSEQGELACTAMSAANEAAVSAFLGYQLGFNAIPQVIDTVLEKIEYPGGEPGLSAVLETDARARAIAAKIIRQRGK